MPPPILSILIPTYNRLSQLKRAIDSVLSQNYNNDFSDKIELIVQDNASTDGTFDYLQTIKNPLLKAYQNPQNLHIYGNMVAPLKNARGEFVLYLTDDDYLLPRSLHKILAFIQSHSYDYIRLNLITFYEKSINALIHRSIPNPIDTNNATLGEIATFLTSSHILSGNIYRRSKIDIKELENARDDELKRWFAYVVLTTRMIDNAYFYNEVLVMHTWENELFWSGADYSDDYNAYNVITDSFNFVLADSHLNRELKRAVFLELAPNVKLYPYTRDYLTSGDIFRAKLRRSITKNAIAFKKAIKKLVFRL